MKCPHCSKDISEKLVKEEAARIAGRKSKRKLTKAQATKMAEARWGKRRLTPMSNLIELAVGSPFPLKNPSGSTDATFANVSGQSFDIICWANNLRSKEVQAWRRGTLRYGVYIRDSIPFFLLYFPDIKWSLDVSINILKEKVAERPYLDYLDGAGNAINLYLIDAKTNTIKAMRMIGIEHELATAARTACRDQLRVYKSAAMLDQHLGNILGQIPTDRMIKNVQMVELRRS